MQKSQIIFGFIEQFQLNGSKFFNDDKRTLKGVSAGALGFSFGLTFSEAAERQYGFRSKMSLLCDKLAQKGKGALILIDEVRTSAAMREVASAYQELVGDQKNIADWLLPHSIHTTRRDCNRCGNGQGGKGGHERHGQQRV